MKVDVVADVGNSRIKWGRCVDGKAFGLIPLAADPDAYARQIKIWNLREPLVWAVCGVHLERRDALIAWLRQRGNTVYVIDHARQLPLVVRVAEPDRVGVDRLLNAIAANDRVQRPVSRIVVDAGSAVTVDWVDAEGVFRGGAIFPGMRLMAKALNDYTALLPLIDVHESNPPLPGVDTRSAIKVGVFWSVAGGIKALVRQMAAHEMEAGKREVFLTGGDAHLLAPVMDSDVILWPEMTLEGVRLAAEALP